MTTYLRCRLASGVRSNALVRLLASPALSTGTFRLSAPIRRCHRSPQHHQSQNGRHHRPSAPRTTTPPVQNNGGNDTAVDAAMFDAVLALSLALYEDEALAAPSALTAQGEESLHDAVASKEVVSPALAPLQSDEVDAYGTLDPDNLMASMLPDFAADSAVGMEGTSTSPTQRAAQQSLMESDLSDKRSLPEPSQVPAQPQALSVRDAGLVGGPASTSALTPPGGSSAGLAALLTTEQAPLEQKVLGLMDAISGHRNGAKKGFSTAGGAAGHGGRRGGKSDSTPLRAPAALTEAATVLLAGLDMKAVLTRGEVAHRHLRHLTLPRCDFSQVRWADVTVEDCDLSRCIFYQSVLHDVVFRRCDFTGCLMKGVSCGGRVLFEDCAFRLAAVGLEYSREEVGGRARAVDAGDDAQERGHYPFHRRGKDAGVRFTRCDFDLSDFQFSRGLTNPAIFVNCSNTHLAAGFPLRARGGVS